MRHERERLLLLLRRSLRLQSHPNQGASDRRRWKEVARQRRVLQALLSPDLEESLFTRRLATRERRLHRQELLARLPSLAQVRARQAAAVTAASSTQWLLRTNLRDRSLLSSLLNLRVVHRHRQAAILTQSGPYAPVLAPRQQRLSHRTLQSHLTQRTRSMACLCCSHRPLT